MRPPTLEEREKFRYKLCKKCGDEYNISIYQKGAFKCYKCEAKERREKK